VTSQGRAPTSPWGNLAHLPLRRFSLCSCRPIFALLFSLILHHPNLPEEDLVCSPSFPTTLTCQQQTHLVCGNRWLLRQPWLRFLISLLSYRVFLSSFVLFLWCVSHNGSIVLFLVYRAFLITVLLWCTVCFVVVYMFKDQINRSMCVVTNDCEAEACLAR
jgi:hypothetical protein